MENKATDKEIKKALECCSEANNCGECEYEPTEHQIGTVGCCNELMKDALDYINRLEAENSNLTSNLTSLQNDLTSAKAEVEELRSNLDVVNHTISYFKAEAVKEFVEKLTDKIGFNSSMIDVYEEIDNLVKEMVGEESAETEKP